MGPIHTCWGLSMGTRAIPAALLLFVAAACGSGDLPTQPTTTGTPLTARRPLGASDVAGEYTLTVTASTSCSLPPDVERRTYTASLEEWPGGVVTVALSGANLAQGLDFFSGNRGGNVIDFEITFGMGAGMGEIIKTELLYFQGTARTTIGDGNISGTFDGVISLYEEPSQLFLPSARKLDCAAADHRIEFVRR